MADENDEKSPGKNIFFGLILIAAGIGCYFWFAHLEEHGGRVRMPVLILLVYNLLGKWGVLGVMGGLGTLLFGSGVKGLFAPKPPEVAESLEPSSSQNES